MRTGLSGVQIKFLIQQSLKTTDQDDAEKQRAEIMRPIMATGRIDALTLMQAKLADAKTEAQTAHDEANPPLALADAWAAYEKATNRPDSTERTLYGYECS